MPWVEALVGTSYFQLRVLPCPPSYPICSTSGFQKLFPCQGLVQSRPFTPAGCKSKQAGVLSIQTLGRRALALVLSLPCQSLSPTSGTSPACFPAILN